MKKKFRIKVDCANCAAKIENAISKIEGVNNISVNFMIQKMSLEAEDDVFESVLKKVIETAKKIEPDFEVCR